MQISLPEILLDPKNKEFWTYGDGINVKPKPNAPKEVKEACKEHNNNVSENADVDDGWLDELDEE